MSKGEKTKNKSLPSIPEKAKSKEAERWGSGDTALVSLPGGAKSKDGRMGRWETDEEALGGAVAGDVEMGVPRL